MERSRVITWEDPSKSAVAAAELAGIDFLQTVTDGKIPLSPILQTLDFKVVGMEHGKAMFSFEPQEFHYNPIGSVHGGVITAILDSAMGCSIHTLLPQGTGYTTLELKVNFIKAVTIKSGVLTATGKVIHSGSRTALVEAQLTGSDGKLYAHATSTCLIFKHPTN